MLFCPHELLQCELLSYFSFEKLPGKHSFSVHFLMYLHQTFLYVLVFFHIFCVSWLHNEYAMFDLSGRFVCFNGRQGTSKLGMIMKANFWPFSK